MLAKVEAELRGLSVVVTRVSKVQLERSHIQYTVLMEGPADMVNGVKEGY